MHVVITGAGRGIGKALSARFSEAGAAVTGTMRHPAGPGIAALEVTDPASHHSFAARLAGRPVDVLICNAGVYPDKGQQLDHGYPAAMWAEAFAVNVTGAFLTVQTLLPNLRLAAREAGIAKIAILSSQMASHQRAPGGSYIYRASKAAALNLGRNLATDLRGERIAVGIYHPGWVKTEMGGPSAEITAEDAAGGLAERIAALSIATTGVFETWDGRPHAY